MKDFINDCKHIGCIFEYVEDSKALKHKSGWCLRVELSNRANFMEIFEGNTVHESYTTTSDKTDEEDEDNETSLLNLIKKSGFDYIDKRPQKGSLWIIAGEEEGRKLVEQCKQYGVVFAFTAKGGRASKNRPAWYSLSSQ